MPKFSDSYLLDLLDREANKEPILLHAGTPGVNCKGFRGLGLKNTGRTLREALQQWAEAFEQASPPSQQGEKG